MSRREDVLVRHRAAIKASAQRHRGLRISLVGSTARGEDQDGSDYDFLVDFREDASLFDMAGLQVELEDLLNASVDVVPSSTVKEHCRGVFTDAIVL